MQTKKSQNTDGVGCTLFNSLNNSVLFDSCFPDGKEIMRQVLTDDVS